MALTALHFLCYAVAGPLVGLSNGGDSAQGAGRAALALLLVCLVHAILIAWLILRSRQNGWRLLAGTFVVFFGITTFMPQIESAFFLTRLPPGTVPRLFLLGVLVAATVSALSVWLLGRNRADETPGYVATPPLPRGTEWGWRLAAIVVAYVTLYFTFGYFIAWQNAALREYYGGIDPGSFAAQMRSVARDTPWLIPFQVLRALLWTVIGVVVIRMVKRRPSEHALMLAILFGVLMNAQLMLPNPYMPEGVRMTHLVETASSNFLFGIVLGYLLSPRKSLQGARS